MMDQSHIDLVALVSRTVRLHRTGRTLRGRCPKHQGTSDTSLTLWETADGWAWYCQAGCGGGDAIAWLRTMNGLDFQAACDTLRLDLPTRPSSPPPPTPPDDAVPPPPAWQAAAQGVADEAVQRLWQPEGAKALRWLRGRGFADATIRAAGLGSWPADSYAARAEWGLAADWDAEHQRWRRLAIPRGITIPWRIEDVLWKLFVRTAAHPWAAKYHQIAGGGNGPWGVDAIQHGKPIILVEGIFDALAVQQEAADLVTPIVTGTTGARRVRWIAQLAQAPLALLSFDADAGGDAPTGYWQRVLPHTRVWRAYYDDPAAMLACPGSVRRWIAAGLTT